MPHIEPTDENVAAFLRRGSSTGPVVMLNLLRFREQADYSRSPHLAPDTPITGAQAYRHYAAHTTPFLQQAGGEVIFSGTGTTPLIGPMDEQWDLVLLVRYPDVQTFLSFSSDDGYLAGVGHRTAALEDSRLLPLSPDARDILGGRT